MIHSEFEWETVSKEQRLVLLSVMLECLKHKNSAARGVNVRLASGLGEREFQEVVDQLLNARILSSDDPRDACRGWLRLNGKNVNTFLVPCYSYVY